MKTRPITVHKGRDMLPRIPLSRMGGVSERWVLLMKVDSSHKVVDRQLMFVRWEAGGACIHGFTHYALLPFYL